MARISGHVVKVKRQRGDVWYMKLRLPDPQRPGRTLSTRRLIGPAWTQRSKPPEGYFTEKTAQEALTALLVDAKRGTLPAGTPGAAPTFSQAVNEWIRHVEREGATATYVRNCESAARRYLIPAFGADTPVAAVESEQVDALRDELMDGPLRPTTAKRVMVMLYGVMRNAQRKWPKLVKGNPCVDHGRVKVPKPSGDYKHLSVEEVMAVARATNDRQDAALIVTAALTGLRLGELRALRWGDVDFGRRTIHVRADYAPASRTPQVGQGAKPAHGRPGGRGAGWAEQARALHRPRRPRVPQRLRPFRQRRKRSASASTRDEAAGLGHSREGPQPFVFHDLRHTFGTLCARAACRWARFRRTWATPASAPPRSTCTTLPSTTPHSVSRKRSAKRRPPRPTSRRPPLRPRHTRHHPAPSGITPP